MKKQILILLLAIISWSTQAQTLNGNYLDINNVKAQVAADGGLFQYGNNGTEVPIGSGKTTLYSSALWIGGYDAGGNLKLAAQTYRQTGNDFFPGPILPSGNYNAAYDSTWNRVWKVKQCDIVAYKNWFTAGQIGSNPLINDSAALEAIMNWPAFASAGQTLAPFYDFNGDGFYDPTTGDVPLIKGDEAIFFVYNDARGAHTETGGAALGVEIQGMAYAYSCTHDSALYNTVFTNYKVINRSSFRVDSAFIGNWTDMDIGYYNDDFIGCDVTRGAYFGYNATAVDGTGQASAYGANPPAEGVVFLDGPFKEPNGIDDAASSVPPSYQNYGDGIIDNERLGMGSFLYFNNSSDPITGNPGASSGGSMDDYYQYMSGAWKNGSHWTYGGNGTAAANPISKYIYPGSSDPTGFGISGIQAPWDEVSSNHTPGDRRGMGSFGPFTMQPGSVNVLDFAYVYGRATQGGPLASLALVKERIDSIKSKCYCNFTCGCGSLSGISEINHQSTLNLYPNPATDNITINYTTTSKNYTINIYNAMGSLVKTISSKNTAVNTINIGELSSGIYLLNITDGNNVSTKRFVKE